MNKTYQSSFVQKIFSLKPLRFFISGGILYVVDVVSTSIAFYSFHLPAWFASAIGFCVSFLVGFLITKNFVFKHNEKSRFGIKLQIALYMLLALLNLVLSSYIVDVAVRTGVRVEVAKTIIVGVMAVWNYFLLNKFIFSVKTK